MELEEYTQYQETKLHEKPGFAYETYLCTIPLDFDRVNLHWHDQMEVIYIKKGRGTVSVNLESYPVEAGCIVPVLPGELHAIDGGRGSCTPSTASPTGPWSMRTSSSPCPYWTVPRRTTGAATT